MTTPTPTAGSLGANTPTPTYLIASLKHTSKEHEHITWWGPNHCGYTPVVGDHCGRYTLAEAQRLNDGLDCLAVPMEAVESLLSPEPYFHSRHLGAAARFYDQRGPVVDNTRANWNRLIAAGLDGRVYVPKPEVFRRKRRSFALEAAAS